MENKVRHKKTVSIILTLILTLSFISINNNQKIINASATGSGGGNGGTVSNDDITIRKTSQVINWDDRTYEVTLQAAAKEETVVVDANPADIVLVLDRSLSMIDALQTTHTPITGQPNSQRDYYILINSNYVKVEYRNQGQGSAGWYYGSGPSRVRVYYAQGGAGENSRYEFYTSIDITKMQIFLMYAGVAELADALALGASAYACRFKSCHPHQKETTIFFRKIVVSFCSFHFSLFSFHSSLKLSFPEKR